MDRMQELAVMTGLNNMFRKGYFDVCVIRESAKIMGVCLGGRAYDILHVLHCVNFADMPQELRESIPALIRECLSLNPIYEFEHLKRQTITVSPVKRFLNFVNG